jgi:hypothetical protein
MTQDPSNDSRFVVTSGEQATVTIQSVQCNCLTTAGFDGTQLPLKHHIPDIYSFPVDGSSGDVKWFACSCQFPPGTPVTAHYNIAVTGAGGVSFGVTPVYMETDDAGFQLRFAIQ